MKALVFEHALARTAVTKALGMVCKRAFVGPTSPLRLGELPVPELPAADWVRIGTRLCGLCGSDYKQVALKGSMDNPMTALISFPQVLGHEVVGVVEETGGDVSSRKPGERVLLNPWLSCVPRGLEPCRWCREGELAQCENFTRGNLSAGIHHGNCREATGGFAEMLVAHESQCIPIPDGVSDEAAVLGDPFAVSLHAVLREPPPPRATVLVYGCGTLGLCSIAILRMRYPTARILAVARYGHQGRLAARLGAHRVLEHRPARRLIESVAGETATDIRRPWYGLPMLTGGVDVVYDTVAKAETLEVGVRITRPRGTIVVTGVEVPKRFEWTPLYFKEISLVGSNAFGFETMDGRRRHAMQWYLDFVAAGKVDVTPMLTHRFPIDRYREAMLCCLDQGRSGAVKVAFEFPPARGN